MNDAERVHEMVHPRPGMVDYLKLALLTAGTVTVASLATWAARTAVGIPPLLAPVLPAVTFVALLSRADMPGIREGAHSRVFLMSTTAMLYLIGVLNGSA